MISSTDGVRLLLVDDDEDDYLITRSMLAAQERLSFELDWAAAYEPARDAIAQSRHDLYLVDYRLGPHNGLDLIRDAGAELAAPVILLTGQGDYNVDLEATELGVTDYLIKGALDGATLERSIRYALRHYAALGELRRSEERYALAVRAANDGIWDWDLVAGTVYFSPRWKSLLGYDEAYTVEHVDAWFELVHPDDVNRLRAEIDAHLAGRSPHFESEHRIRHADGDWRWVLSRGVATRDDAGEPERMAGSLSDITARRNAEQQLIHGALHDPLTGLPNRALFMDRLEQRLERARRNPEPGCAVLFIDVDRFKLVNDSLSHASGDRLLQELAGRLTASLRSGDTVARLGGDEFTILLDEVALLDDALVTARRVQEALAEPFALDGRNLAITVSIGIASNADGITAAELVRNADIAMYEAKQHGRARASVFDARMHDRIMSRMSLETQLRQAIDEAAAAHVLPADRRPAHGGDRRARGARALAGRGHRDPARRLHPDRRGGRADRRARPARPADGVPHARGLAPARDRRPGGADQRQRLGAAADRGRPDRRPRASPCATPACRARTSCSRSPRAR